MIAKQILEIGSNDFLLGMTSSETTSDGGFSPTTPCVSITGELGVLRSAPAMTSRATFNGNVIATCGDAKISAIGNDKNFITDTGRFYSYQSNTATLRQTGGGSKNYIFPTTDIIQFQTDTYVTSDTDIARLIQSNLTQPDVNWESWWTVTKGKTALGSGYRHPMVVFENSLWIGDGPYLHKWDGTTASYAFLTLSSEQAIIALGVDPSTGKMLISINEGFNAANTIPAISKILTYNGYSNKPDRAIVVDDMVTAIYPLGGTVFMAYGQKLGYWNGTGISFLRKFKNISLNADQLVYKHHITNIGNTLYVADGLQILAFGESIAGKKVFYYAQKPTDANLSYLTAIGYVGNNELGLFYYDGTNKKLMTFDVTYTGTSINAQTFYSKRYQFPRPIFVRGIYVEYADAVSNSSTPGTIALDSERLDATVYGSLTNSTGSTVYSKHIENNSNSKFRTLQLRYTASISTGIRRFVIEYDFAE